MGVVGFRFLGAVASIVGWRQVAQGRVASHSVVFDLPVADHDVGEYTDRRQIRGATYVITVKSTGAKGAVLTVDGQAIEGNTVPYAPTGSTVEVVATP